MRLVLAAALVCAAPALAQPAHDESSTEPLKPKQETWSFDGPFGTYDRAALQRGFQVYREVCSNCHSMKELYYRNLTGGGTNGSGGTGIGLTPEQTTAVAASVQVATTNDDGQPAERPGLPSDHFRSPFPNDKAARAANGGALPPDQSLIEKAREDGPNYIFSLLTGYRDAPPDHPVGAGQYYNPYFPGHALAMPQPLHDQQVSYADGTPATVEQMSHDVVQFLTWASSPELETRKRMGIKIVSFLVLMTGLTYALKRKIWKDVH